MLAALLLLLALAAGIVAVLMAHPDSGYVLISYGPWLVETSLATLLAGVTLWFLAIWVLARLAAGLLRLPGRLRQTIDDRARERARRSFITGLGLLFEGRFAAAELELVRHGADFDAPHLSYLAAARAAQRLGADQRREHYLRLATELAPADLRPALLVTQIELQRERGDHEAARVTAEALRRLVPDHPYAPLLLAESLAALGHWPALRELLEAPGARVLDPAQRRRLRLRALRGLVAAAAASGRLDQLKAVWDAAGPAREDPDLRADYARALAQLGADGEAAAVIAEALDRDWLPQLAALYAELALPAPLTQLAAVEKWLTEHGEHAELLAAAGRACLRQQLWGKAQSYLDSALRLAPSPRAYLDLAQLAEAVQQPQDAARYYREGLRRAVGELG
ncbi:MAG: hypothetical protein KGJ55_07130 [Gammaproteobacteria bacterium]|nr:hypothetical protein [Gammaproteobacteria bacterium]